MVRFGIPSALLVALLAWWGVPASGQGVLAQTTTPVSITAQCPSPLATPVAAPAASPAASPAATTGEPVCVGVLLVDFKVQPERTTLRVNQPYIFAVGNAGETVHEFVIEPAGAVDEPLEVESNGEERESELEDIATGETKELAWTFTEPGRYQFACHIPAHFEAGMVVEFEVRP